MPALIQKICLRTSLLMFASVALAGCGGSAPAAVGPASEQVVFTAAADCAATTKVKEAQCAQAIETALQQHLAGSTVYRTLTLCETTEGAEKCEKMDAKAYRPRLSAIVVNTAAVAEAETTGATLVGTPLYPTLAGEHGFRKLDKTILLVEGDMMVFSPQAIAAAELNATTATP
jgi:Protein of unknown function (DUF1190)